MNTGCPISFTNRDGLTLHGFLHSPTEGTRRDVCVLLLSPGIKGRVAPHRLYLKIAERMVAMGFHVLRFDFHGLGDSQGQLNERVLASMYRSIQLGRYVDDTVDAMNWLERDAGIRKFVGSGLCGGSITALLTASRDPRIVGLLGLGIPTALDVGPEQSDRFLTRGQLEVEGKRYLRNLLKPASWRRFLTGKSGYGLIMRSLRQLWSGRSTRASSPKQVSASGTATPGTQDNTNPHFAPSLLSLIQKRAPICLIFSGSDRLLFEFSEKFEQKNAEALAAEESPYEIHVIEKANHILSDPAWVSKFLDIACPWLDQTFPDGSRG